MANIIGTKWGSSELGTAGGTVTWSIAAAGTDISRFGVETQTSVSGDSFLSYDFEQVIANAFAEWSKYGDIEFEQVADQGGAAGVGADADIRIYFGAIPGGTAGYAFYPSSWGSAIAGDILLDTISAFENDPVLFFNLVLHEIGHALGLGHVSSDSIMTPTVKKIGLQADDIAGIQEIYGVQDDAPAPHDEGCDCPSCCNNDNDGSNTDGSNTDGSNTDNSHDGHNHDEIGHDHNHDDPNHSHGEDDQAPTAEILEGDNGNNRLIGTSASEVINGLDGNDTIRGSAGDDTINGGDGADRLHGGTGNDTVSGQDGNDVLKGHSGNDYLNGGAGRDKIRGGEGEDTINGGSGNDRLFGVDGDDIFEFSDGHGHDLIRDYNARGETDLIDLSGVSGFNNFSDVLAAASTKKSHVVIATGDDSSITLYRTDLSELEASDFLF